MTANIQTRHVATILDRYLLTKDGSTKKTYHIVLKLPSPIEYQVGDSVAIFPKNPNSLVESILLYFPKGSTILHKKTKETLPLKEYLLSSANLCKITPHLLRKIGEKIISPKLNSLLLPENKPALKSYLEERQLIDLLEEYPNALIPQNLGDHLLPLLPRYYSIASSCKKDPLTIELTVAHVQYQSLGKTRIGVGSSFLCEEIEKGSSISFFVQSSNGFTLPDPSEPIIMIGPGTGIAPFKGFLEERMHQNAPGKNWLFFGERNGKTDFYYSDFFKGLEAENKLTLTTAFSRDQEKKLYVQHQMLKHQKQLFSWIESGAILYVCGDAKKMAKDVDLALLQIISSEKNLSEADAKAYLKNLRREKRYLTDVY